MNQSPSTIRILKSAMLTAAVTLVACSNTNPKPDGTAIGTEGWPIIQSEVPKDPAIEARVDKLLAQMTLEEKVGQIIQGEIRYLEPSDLREYHLGSVLNGGGAFPNNKKQSTAKDWVALADKFYLASTDKSDGRTGIPALWGSDAVHGHNNVFGATIFPHNIGLGAANNPQLVFEIAEATAREVAATGLDWTFAPTLAVVRDDRWGRTYESYSEDPEIVASYAGKVVHGIQGRYGTPSFMDSNHLLANAKHYVGDGGTEQGKDQGNNIASEQELRDIHAQGYFSALEAGVQIVMTSFSSWQGTKMHAHKYLMTEVLKNRMGFDGFIVSDWNAHAQIPGCSEVQCAEAINAGIDMVMVPEHWREFYLNTLNDVREGNISESRLDDAVRRILRVKARSGLLDEVMPSKRDWVRNGNGLGSDQNRAIARKAVQQSLVLIKNNNRTLPISPKSNVLMVGDGANSIGKQSGGWTLSWQGTGNANSDFPNGSSIYDGIRELVEAAGGQVELSEDGSYTQKPSVVIAVYGEDPYAEYQGDVESLYYKPGNDSELKLLKSFADQGIAVVSVFLSGRPLWVNPYINASDAFVAAWLPGSEGAGVADVLVGAANGQPRHDFQGKLSFSWPKYPMQTPLNRGDKPYDPLFAYGYGLTYNNKQNMPLLSEDPKMDVAAAGANSHFLRDGQPVTPWQHRLIVDEKSTPVTGLISATDSAAKPVLKAELTDRNKQGDTLRLTWSGDASASYSLFRTNNLDLSRETLGGLALGIEYRLEKKPAGPVSLSVGCGNNCQGTLPFHKALDVATPGEWQYVNVSLACIAKAGMSPEQIIEVLRITSADAMSLTLANVRVTTAAEGAPICPE